MIGVARTWIKKVDWEPKSLKGGLDADTMIYHRKGRRMLYQHRADEVCELCPQKEKPRND
jgi:hypothetical protein